MRLIKTSLKSIIEMENKDQAPQQNSSEDFILELELTTFEGSPEYEMTKECNFRRNSPPLIADNIGQPAQTQRDSQIHHQHHRTLHPAITKGGPPRAAPSVREECAFRSGQEARAKCPQDPQHMREASREALEKTQDAFAVAADAIRLQIHASQEISANLDRLAQCFNHSEKKIQADIHALERENATLKELFANHRADCLLGQVDQNREIGELYQEITMQEHSTCQQNGFVVMTMNNIRILMEELKVMREEVADIKKRLATSSHSEAQTQE